jgi:hypothetical protein
VLVLVETLGWAYDHTVGVFAIMARLSHYAIGSHFRTPDGQQIELAATGEHQCTMRAEISAVARSGPNSRPAR